MTAFPWRRRLPRYRVRTYTNALTGAAVQVQVPTLWSRIVYLWECWRRPL